MTWLLGRKVPGDDGNKYRPEGYVIREVGPAKLKEKGQEYMRDDVDKLFARGPGMCPFR